MIRLFDRNETNFNHNETTLTDVLSAKVIEEGNGMFEVEIEHPRNEFAKTLIAGKVVKVPTASGEQLFRIYKPVKNLTRYKLYARHIFYDLAKNFIEDIRPTGKNGMSAIHDILTAAQYAHPFTGTSNISDIGTAYYIRMNPIQAMMSADNSFLDTWGGELVRDNFTFSINAAGGTDRGYEIRIGKNLTGIDVTMDETAVYTRIYPTVVINDNVVTTLPEKYVDSPLIEAYEYPKIIEERISLTDDQKGWPVEDIYTLMRDHCDALFESGIDKPVINYKVNFVELSKTEQYKDLQILEQLNLYDTVTIRVAELDIDIKAKVVKTTYDGLKERYISMELGSFMDNMASQTKNTLAHTDKKINAATSSLQQAFDKAQSMITGNLGGYRIDRYNAEGLPYETLWMDTPDINTAVNVIRINQQGIGFSQSGYNGPFKAAITIDGHIVADFIDVGLLKAEMIQAGFNGISQGVSMTADGLKAVAASGEYSIVEDGGVSFFTKNDVKTGSIESGYLVSGGTNGVSVFVEPGRFFSVNKKNELGVNERFIHIPHNKNEIMLQKPVSVTRLNIAGTDQYITNMSNQGGVFFDTVRVSLGTGTLDAVSKVISAEPGKAIIHTPSFFNGPITTKSSSSTIGGKIFDNNDVLLVGGADGTNIGYTNGIGITSIARFMQGNIIAYTTLNMNGNVITNQSDIRLKTNIKDAEVDPFAIIEKMRFIEFDWDMTNPYNKNKPEGRYFGIEAQYAPFLVVKDVDSNYLSIDMGKQVSLNSLANQKLIAELKETKQELADLKTLLTERGVI